VLKVESAGALKAHVGKEIGVSDWLTVTQERIQQFAEATEDRQWIHTDPARAARESPYGATIAHGFLTLSLISTIARQVLEIGGMRLAVNYGLNRVRFPSAVRAGARIRGHVQLMSIKDVEGGEEATFVCVVETEGAEKPCCIAEWIVRYYV
jgi:acyl dehydratase